jgi:sodium pump decarboxylase gamma subunit
MDWSFILSTVVTGLAVVFIILLFLIGLLVLMGKLLSEKRSRKPVIMPVKPAVKIAVPVQKPATQAAPAIPKTDELQVIAVITAAINAYSEETGKKLKITGIKKREQPARSVWGNAGVYESMR